MHVEQFFFFSSLVLTLLGARDPFAIVSSHLISDRVFYAAGKLPVGAASCRPDCTDHRPKRARWTGSATTISSLAVFERNVAPGPRR